MAYPARKLYLMSEIGIHEHAVIDWGSFIREVFFDWALNDYSTVIGGPGIVVEIDEAKFGKRKSIEDG